MVAVLCYRTDILWTVGRFLSFTVIVPKFTRRWQFCVTILTYCWLLAGLCSHTLSVCHGVLHHGSLVFAMLWHVVDCWQDCAAIHYQCVTRHPISAVALVVLWLWPQNSSQVFSFSFNPSKSMCVCVLCVWLWSSVFPAISLGFTILGEIFVYMTIFFSPALEVVTFRLDGCVCVCVVRA